jgi:hypothetical protein
MNETYNWQHAAVGKFFDLSTRAAGQRADLTAKLARRAELVHGLADLERKLDDIEQHISAAPVLHGREADRNRTIDHVATIRDDIARRKALLAGATAAVGAAIARNDRLAPLVGGCAMLLHRLGFLTREEAQI